MSAEEANQLIEDLKKRNYRALVETSRNDSRVRAGGMLELNMMTTIEEKLDVLMSKMSTQEMRSHLANTVEIEERREQKGMTNGEFAHEVPYQVKEAQFVSGNISYNFKPNNNLETHYTPALRNHENFFYGSGVQLGPIPRSNYQQQYVP